jgi:hypothetical protein
MYCDSLEKRVEFKKFLENKRKQAVNEKVNRVARKEYLKQKIEASQQMNESNPMERKLTTEELAVKEACSDNNTFHAPMLLGYLTRHFKEEPTIKAGLSYTLTHLNTGEGCVLIHRHGILNILPKIFEEYIKSQEIQLQVISILRQLLNCNYTRDDIMNEEVEIMLKMAYTITYRYMHDGEIVEAGSKCLLQICRYEHGRALISKQQLIPYIVILMKKYMQKKPVTKLLVNIPPENKSTEPPRTVLQQQTQATIEEQKRLQISESFAANEKKAKTLSNSPVKPGPKLNQEKPPIDVALQTSTILQTLFRFGQWYTINTQYVHEFYTCKILSVVLKAIVYYTPTIYAVEVIKPCIMILYNITQYYVAQGCMKDYLSYRVIDILLPALQRLFDQEDIQLFGLKVIQQLALTSEGFVQLNERRGAWIQLCSGSMEGDALIHNLHWHEALTADKNPFPEDDPEANMLLQKELIAKQNAEEGNNGLLYRKQVNIRLKTKVNTSTIQQEGDDGVAIGVTKSTRQEQEEVYLQQANASTSLAAQQARNNKKASSFQNSGWTLAETPYLPYLEKQKLKSYENAKHSLHTDNKLHWTTGSLREYMGLSMSGQTLAINTEYHDFFFNLLLTLDLLPRYEEVRENWYARLRQFEQENEVKLEEMVHTIQEMKRREAIQAKLQSQGLMADSNAGNVMEDGKKGSFEKMEDRYDDVEPPSLKEIFVLGQPITSQYLQENDVDLGEVLAAHEVGMTIKRDELDDVIDEKVQI